MATKSSRDQYRKEFEATAVTELKKIVKKDDQDMPSKGGKTDFHSIEDGLNKFRFYPKHKGEKNFYFKMGRHWMTIELESGETGRRTILNAKVHAGWKKDPIDEYIAFTQKNLNQSDADDANKIKKMLSWQDGIGMQTTWIAYADKLSGSDQGFGITEFKKLVRDAINNESIIEDEDEAISVDPYTDIDDGKPALITYNSKAKKAADYYKVQLSKKSVPLTDAQLEAFKNVTPLSQLDMLKYTPAEFDRALSGIQIFDADNEIDLFDSDEFQEIIEACRAQFDGVDSDDEEEEETKTVKKSSKTVSKGKKQEEVEEDEEEEEIDEEEEEEEEEEEAEEEEEGDDLDDMDRSELKKHIKENSLEIKVTTKMSDDDIRDAIRELSGEDEEEEIEEEEDEDEEEEVEEKTTKKTPPAKKGAKTLEEIKAELRKKQGKK